MKQYIENYKQSVQEFISASIDNGYELIQISEGCCGYGHFVLLSPDETHWSFEVKEVYRNEWTSWHEFRRFIKVSKRLQKQINNALED